MQSKGPEGIVIAVVGNKADLEDRSQVEREEAQAYADEIGAIFVETSAKTGDNVQDLFASVARDVMKKVRGM